VHRYALTHEYDRLSIVILTCRKILARGTADIAGGLIAIFWTALALAGVTLFLVTLVAPTPGLPASTSPLASFVTATGCWDHHNRLFWTACAWRRRNIWRYIGLSCFCRSCHYRAGGFSSQVHSLWVSYASGCRPDHPLDIWITSLPRRSDIRRSGKAGFRC